MERRGLRQEGMAGNEGSEGSDKGLADPGCVTRAGDSGGRGRRRLRRWRRDGGGCDAAAATGGGCDGGGWTAAAATGGGFAKVDGGDGDGEGCGREWGSEGERGSDKDSADHGMSYPTGDAWLAATDGGCAGGRTAKGRCDGRGEAAASGVEEARGARGEGSTRAPRTRMRYPT